MQQVIPISLGFVKCYLIKGEKNILVDTGLPGHGDKIISQLKATGVELDSISLIVVTHNHTDHVGELKKFRDLTNAKIAIHASEAEALRQGKTTEVVPVTNFAKIITKFFKNPIFESVTPDIEVEQELSLEEFGVKGKVLHTPGHTKGSISIVLENGETIAGDLFTAKGKDKAKLPFFASDLPQLKITLNKLSALSPKVIYTSHGDACSNEAMKALADKM